MTEWRSPGSGARASATADIAEALSVTRPAVTQRWPARGGPARPRGRGGGAMTETTCSWCDTPATSTVRTDRFLPYPAGELHKALKERKLLPEERET